MDERCLLYAVGLSGCYARFCLWAIYFLLCNLQVTMWADVLDYYDNYIPAGCTVCVHE